MEKYDSVIIAIAIILGAVIVGGALLFSSTMTNLVSSSVTISDILQIILQLCPLEFIMLI